jgi:hypothetical protein
VVVPIRNSMVLPALYRVAHRARLLAPDPARQM